VTASGLFLLLATLTPLGTARFALADPACFDFGHKISAGLPLPSPYAPASPEKPKKEDKGVALDAGGLAASGKKSEGLYWAAVEGDSSRGISELIQELVTHVTTKPGRASEMKIKLVPDPNFQIRQEVKFQINPFPFVKVEWTEDWAFSLLAGDARKPEKMLVAYEKVDGTSHIRHLCGQFELSREASGKTRIRIYEEAAATGRSQQDTLSGIATSLRKLQN
jgi:hypothetical protein